MDETYELVTRRFDFDATEILYNSLAKGDFLIISKSRLTNSIQRVIVINQDIYNIYSVGYIRARGGVIYNAILILILSLAITSYKKNTLYRNKKSLPYILLVFSLLILGFHLGLEHLFF